ncbi:MULTISPECIES: DNA-processing protein DprA [Ramlibacter]|uniref:DNA-protecting protein DprA n=1 Tax=Ramlibacter pinisoli TaxID=2682844 RepID=A0A6N8J268_9BURK|nr:MULTISPECIES: DNA-processing protein DprA [Ramlibacter]MBA2962962.1 DNA-protecting protein DprA [Ramlibacter sp. CGMCC 1.13660]MVQ32905.1 DNA-protecting protein DprA [Ramlibacter pinisoli]
MEREELAAWLRLAQTPGVGRATARRLLAAFGLPGQLFTQTPQALDAVLPPALAEALLAEPPGWADQVERTWAWLQEGADRRLLTLADPDYPPALLQTEDPPLLLYAHGQPCAPWPAAIAVVGSRNPTPQGLAHARDFGRAFAQAGLTVVSGLALGIDGAAHEGALEGAGAGQLATIAVVGTGLDRVYPSRHLELAHRIARQGLLLSEYPLGMGPLAANFPPRNRIISALGQGTLVVEAALQSGSLITARMAVEQGKDVFAIPGSIHSPQARGCHALLKQGAKLVETAQDVLEELAPAAVAAPRAPAPAVHEAPVDRRATALLEALGFDPVGLDALVARTGIAASTLQAHLLELELAGRVARLPGGLFQRQASA